MGPSSSFNSPSKDGRVANGFLMNIWQIEMERSPYSNTLLFNRNTKLSLSIGLLLLFPALVQGADSLYDQQNLQRAKASTPLSQLPSAVPAAACLNPSQVADWLQVASGPVRTMKW